MNSARPCKTCLPRWAEPPQNNPSKYNLLQSHAPPQPVEVSSSRNRKVLVLAKLFLKHKYFLTSHLSSLGVSCSSPPRLVRVSLCALCPFRTSMSPVGIPPSLPEQRGTFISKGSSMHLGGMKMKEVNCGKQSSGQLRLNKCVRHWVGVTAKLYLPICGKQISAHCSNWVMIQLEILRG